MPWLDRSFPPQRAAAGSGGERAFEIGRDTGAVRKDRLGMSMAVTPRLLRELLAGPVRPSGAPSRSTGKPR